MRLVERDHHCDVCNIKTYCTLWCAIKTFKVQSCDWICVIWLAQGHMISKNAKKYRQRDNTTEQQMIQNVTNQKEQIHWFIMVSTHSHRMIIIIYNIISHTHLFQPQHIVVCIQEQDWECVYFFITSLHYCNGDLHQVMIALTTEYSLYVSGMRSSTEFNASSTRTSIMLSILDDLTKDYTQNIMGT